MNRQTIYLVTDQATFEGNKIVGAFLSKEEAESLAIRINLNGESWGFGEEERSACVQEMEIGIIQK